MQRKQLIGLGMVGLGGLLMYGLLRWQPEGVFGFLLMLTGALLLVLYLLLTRKCRKQEAKQECFHTYWYGYDLQQDVPAAMQYAAYLSRYAGRWNEEGEKSEDASERRDDQK